MNDTKALRARAASRRYLQDPSKCPFCEGLEFLTGEIMSDDLVGDNSEVYQWIECNTCESKWRDVFLLTHADEFEQGEDAKRHGFTL